MLQGYTPAEARYFMPKSIAERRIRIGVAGFSLRAFQAKHRLHCHPREDGDPAFEVADF